MNLHHVKMLTLVLAAAVLLLISLESIFHSGHCLIAGAAAFLLLMMVQGLFNRCPHCKKNLGRDTGTYCPHCGKKL